VDSQDTPRDNFFVGESIFIAGTGLFPHASVEIALIDLSAPDRRVSNASTNEHPSGSIRLVTDRHGNLPTTLLEANLGLPDASQSESRSIVESIRTFEERDFEVRVQVQLRSRSLKRSVRFRVVAGSSPAIFVTTATGQLLRAGEHGDVAPSLLLHNFPAGCVRVTVVQRQFGWRSGDLVEPVRTARGREMTVTFSHDGQTARVMRLPKAWTLSPGGYQFIARHHQPGWFEAVDPHLLATDVVSDHRFASLVVRANLKSILDAVNGIVLTPEIAGRPVAHQPYFRFTNNFPVGTDVYAALDPDHLPVGLLSKRAAIYVIEHKTASQWANDSTLTDISGPGMTPAAKVVPIVPGCVNWNRTLVWANPQQPGKYDIAIDFGNNVVDPGQFATDGSLDPPLDMIDGYVRVGFYVTDDPSLSGPFAGSIGVHDYALPSIQVPSGDATPIPTTSVPLTATIRYPATSSGVDASCASGSFPLVVMMHGNSNMESSYLGYNYLLDHLASHGFIAMSIYAPSGLMIEGRARIILSHLATMAQLNSVGLFHNHIDMANIGIAGHSRGGEAVVRASRINAAESLGWNLKAAVSIAPTDYHHDGPAGVPQLVIYGSNDGDVSGDWPNRTCFNIYDEAGRPRSFIFVYGGTHDRFNTEWASIESSSELQWDITPSDYPNLISLTDHENVAKGYVTAFTQLHLQRRTEQEEYFSANLRPSLTSALQIHTSHQTAASLALDNFEQLPHAVGANTLGGSVTSSGAITVTEDQLRTLDAHSPHVTSGGAIDWQASGAGYVTNVPTTARDISGFSLLRFRVTQKFGSGQNPSNQPQDLYVRITDLNGKSRALRTSVFTDIPYPYVRGHADLIKSALKSVAIPLDSFTIANLGADDVDLTRVISVAFEFTATASGEVEVDDIEFA
jgi:hypothetical protein